MEAPLEAPWWKMPLFFIRDTPISLINLGGALFLIIATFVVAKWVRFSISRLGVFKRYISQAALYGLGRFAYYGVVALGLYLTLATLGVNLTGIAVVLGALSVGIGFGLQNVFNNLIAGVIVLVEKKARVGDQIQIDAKEMGTVIEINVRSTLIRTLDDRKVLIPNTTLVASQLTNWTLGQQAFYRLRIPFVVDRDVDREQARTVALMVGNQVAFTCKEPRAEVWLTQVAPDGVAFELIVWIDLRQRAQVKTSYAAAYVWALTEAFEKEGIALQRVGRSEDALAAQGL